MLVPQVEVVEQQMTVFDQCYDHLRPNPESFEERRGVFVVGAAVVVEEARMTAMTSH